MRSLSRIGVLDEYPIVVAGLREVFHRHDPPVDIVSVDAGSLAVENLDVLLCEAVGGVVGVSPDLHDLIRRTSAAVVLFAGDLAPPVVDAALQAGVSAYLPKTSSGPQVVAAIEAVHLGQRVSAPAVDEQRTTAGTWMGLPSDLSPRELEIIVYIASGRSNDEIARELFLGLNTVKTYIRGAYRKIGVQRRTHAVLWAIDNGVVPHRTAASLLGTPDPSDDGSRAALPTRPATRRTRPRTRRGADLSSV